MKADEVTVNTFTSEIELAAREICQRKWMPKGCLVTNPLNRGMTFSVNLVRSWTLNPGYSDFLARTTLPLSRRALIGVVSVQDKLQCTTWSVDLIPSGVVGVDKNLEGICEELRAAQRLAIVGMGGIGKTTIMGILHKNIKRGFDYTCFVEDVKTLMGSGRSSALLKETINTKLLFNGRKVGQHFDWEMLRHKKVLMMLDDVDSTSDTFIFKEFEGFSLESRLVVTSREKKFLREKSFVLYEMKCLDSRDAELLLCQHAFKQDQSPPAFQEHIRNMSARLGNLPLALVIAGADLSTESEEYWRETYDSISEAYSLNGDEDDGLWSRLWSVLGRSYASLSAHEKEMFLDIATIYHGWNLERVMLAWKFSDWAKFPHRGWQHLYNKCLVSVSPGGHISMHELLRNYGRSKACPGYPSETSSYSRIFYISTAIEVIRKMERTPQEPPKVKLMKVNGHGLDPDDGEVRVGHEVGVLSNLKVVWLEAIQADNLLQTFLRLFQHPAQLTFLHVSSCGVSMRQICKIGTLRCLILSDLTFITSLHSLGQLRQLEYLEMDCVFGVTDIPPGIRSLTSLRHLHIQWCSDLKSIPPEIGELWGLTVLHIEGCNSLRALPNSIAQLRTLENLTLANCEQMVFAMSTLRALPALTSLYIEGCKVDGWHGVRVLGGGRRWELRNMTSFPIKVSNFHMRGENDLLISMWDDARNSSICCGHVKVLLETREELRPHYLDLYIREKDHQLPDLPREVFQELQKLTISSEASRHWNFPLILGPFPMLRELTIASCINLEAILETLPQALQKLKIVECAHLTALPATIVQLTVLRELHIESCGLFAGLPATIGQLTALRELHIESCGLYEGLPATIGQLTALRELHIESCGHFADLPATVGQLPTLEVLSLRDLPSLRELPGSVLRAKAVQELAIERCGIGMAVEERIALAIEERTAWDLANLEVLKISMDEFLFLFPHFGECEIKSESHFLGTTGTMQLTVLKSPSHFPKVRCLSISGGNTAGASYMPSRELLQLAHLIVRDHRIPFLGSGSLGHLSALKHLEISRCLLKTLPQSIEKLVGLERLTLNDCPYLDYLPSSLWSLTSLKPASIHCYQGRAIGLDNLGAVEHLEVTLDCPPYTLKEYYDNAWFQVWDDIRSLKSLKSLIIRVSAADNSYLWRGRKIPESIGNLTSLEYLEIRDRTYLEELPASMGELPRLQILVIQRCKDLVKVPHSMGQLLDNFEISDCPMVEKLPIFRGDVKKVLIQRCRTLEEWRPSLDHVSKMQELEFTHDDWRVPVGGTFLTTVFKHGDLVCLAEAGQSLQEAVRQIQRDKK